MSKKTEGPSGDYEHLNFKDFGLVTIDKITPVYVCGVIVGFLGRIARDDARWYQNRALRWVWRGCETDATWQDIYGAFRAQARNKEAAEAYLLAEWVRLKEAAPELEFVP